MLEQELGKLAGYDRHIASPKYFRTMVESTMKNAGQHVPESAS